jgi:cobalamin biosynthesis Mg chelatase CobN
MPGKTRRKRARLSNQSKKKIARQKRPATAVQQTEVAQTQQPLPPSNVSGSPATGTAQKAKTSATYHPYIASELWTIGILAVVMLVILIVLALVLS